MFKYLLVFLFFLSTAAMHPFHVSVCEIDYDQKTKVMQITQRFFIDDMETALSQITKKKDFNISSESYRAALDEFYKAYFSEKLSISVNGKLLEVSYLGYELEDGAIWCYLETEKVKKINTVNIKNKLLFETFEDQSNIIHIKIFEKTRSLKLTNRNEKGTVTFEN